MSSLHDELAEVMRAVETGGIRTAEDVLRDDDFVDLNRARCVRASKEMHSILAMQTSAEALAIVSGVDSIGPCGSVGKTARELQQKNTGTNVQSATRVHAPEARKRT